MIQSLPELLTYTPLSMPPSHHQLTPLPAQPTTEVIKKHQRCNQIVYHVDPTVSGSNPSVSISYGSHGRQYRFSPHVQSVNKAK